MFGDIKPLPDFAILTPPHVLWDVRRGSNPRPLDLESNALPIELRPSVSISIHNQPTKEKPRYAFNRARVSTFTGLVFRDAYV